MSKLIKKIQMYENEAEEKILQAQKKARDLIKVVQKKAEKILAQAQELTEQEKNKIIEEIGQQTFEQIKKQEYETKFALGRLKKDPIKREKAVERMVKKKGSEFPDIMAFYTIICASEDGLVLFGPPVKNYGDYGPGSWEFPLGVKRNKIATIHTMYLDDANRQLYGK